jgi:hypothetical protein
LQKGVKDGTVSGLLVNYIQQFCIDCLTKNTPPLGWSEEKWEEVLIEVDQLVKLGRRPGDLDKSYPEISKEQQMA